MISYRYSPHATGAPTQYTPPPSLSLTRHSVLYKGKPTPRYFFNDKPFWHVPSDYSVFSRYDNMPMHPVLTSEVSRRSLVEKTEIQQPQQS